MVVQWREGFEVWGVDQDEEVCGERVVLGREVR